MDYQTIIEKIYRDIQPFLSQGSVADYIPALDRVPLQKFGMAVQELDHRLLSVGDAEEYFSIQSISKAFTLILALQLIGERNLLKRVGLEPSGNPFNSLVQLEHNNGIPSNPFVNAGALVLADILLSHSTDAYGLILDFVRKISGNDQIRSDPAVSVSERETGFRNAALANFLKSCANLDNEVDAVLDLYVFQCALSMRCVDVCQSFLTLANHGQSSVSGRQILSPGQAKRINALMLTCGTYDGVGDFAYRVGLPGKSGVGGGIAAFIPGRLSVTVWSPGLNKNGNSLAGTQALEWFTTQTGMSIF